MFAGDLHPGIPSANGCGVKAWQPKFSVRVGCRPNAAAPCQPGAGAAPALRMSVPPAPGASIPDLRVRLRNWLLSDGVRAIQGRPVEVGRGRITLNKLRTSS